MVVLYKEVDEVAKRIEAIKYNYDYGEVVQQFRVLIDRIANEGLE